MLLKKIIEEIYQNLSNLFIESISIESQSNVINIVDIELFCR